MESCFCKVVLATDRGLKTLESDYFIEKCDGCMEFEKRKVVEMKKLEETKLSQICSCDHGYKDQYDDFPGQTIYWHRTDSKCMKREGIPYGDMCKKYKYREEIEKEIIGIKVALSNTEIITEKIKSKIEEDGKMHHKETMILFQQFIKNISKMPRGKMVAIPNDFSNNNYGIYSEPHLFCIELFGIRASRCDYYVMSENILNEYIKMGLNNRIRVITGKKVNKFAADVVSRKSHYEICRFVANRYKI